MDTSVLDLEVAMNNFYPTVEGMDWQLQSGQNGNHTPFYTDGLDEYVLPIVFYFDEGKLKSFKAFYENSYHETLIKRIDEDFKSGGYVNTDTHIFYAYARTMAEAGFKVTLEIRYDKSKQSPILFEASYEKLSPKSKEKSNEQKVKGSRRDTYTASVRCLLAYCVFLSTNVL